MVVVEVDQPGPSFSTDVLALIFAHKLVDQTLATVIQYYIRPKSFNNVKQQRVKDTVINQNKTVYKKAEDHIL